MKDTVVEKASSAAFADTKPHYELLDGLRGVAALLVIWYHVFEGFATSPYDQRFNHGYLAVAFFFILSGFVIGYAYDDRWPSGKMTLKSFFKRRLIRLHPMVVMGAVLGAVAFCMQGCEKWDHTAVSLPWVGVALVMGCLLLPVLPGTGPEVRGNGEMYPLNGPSWSLFFEYVGNILYALFIRRLSVRWLAVLVGASALGLAGYAVGNGSGYGHLGVGWTLAGTNLPGGMLRLLFAFPMGLLMSRVFRPVHIRGAFWLCSLIVALLLSVPHVGGSGAPWMNGVYDTVCVVLVFPVLVWLGASGCTTDRTSSRICKFLGDISYPIYIVHYPSMYLFYAWVWNNGLTFGQVWPAAAGLFIGNILLAYLCLKFYDEPVRKWLKRFYR